MNNKTKNKERGNEIKNDTQIGDEVLLVFLDELYKKPLYESSFIPSEISNCWRTDLKNKKLKIVK